MKRMKSRYHCSGRAIRRFKRSLESHWHSRDDGLPSIWLWIAKGHTEVYRGQEYAVNLVPMVKVETVVCDVPVDLVMDTARDTLQTGEVGDGKIFVYDVEDSMRIRTGTRGTKAVTDDEA